MKTISLDTFATNLDGSKSEQHLGKIVGNALFNLQSTPQYQIKDPVKLHNWSIALFNCDSILLDESDEQLFKDSIKVLGLPVWAAGEVAKILNKAEADKPKKK